MLVLFIPKIRLHRASLDTIKSFSIWQIVIFYEPFLETYDKNVVHFLEPSMFRAFTVDPD